MTKNATLRVFPPGSSDDPGVEWAADVLARLADLLGDFLLAVVRLGAYVVGSVRDYAVGRL